MWTKVILWFEGNSIVLPEGSMAFARSDKREHERHDFPSTIEYVLEPDIHDAVIHKGVTINLSNIGMALYVFDALAEGQNIFIKTALPVDYRAATVRWIRKEDRSFYLSGMQFF